MKQIRHGHTTHEGSSPTYKSWHMMKQRCTNPANTQYRDYGGRGITVCDRWMKFTNFLEDMGTRPVGTTLERKDNNKGYEPGNCKWATRAEQAKNRRSVHLIEFRGISQTLSDWARSVGIKPHTLLQRLDNGWGVERALTTPRQLKGRAVKGGGAE